MDNARLLLTSPHWRQDDSGNLQIWHSAEINAYRPKPGFSAPDLSPMEGNWAIAEERENEIVLATDLPRSHPLVYTYNDGSWIVSDDIERLRELVEFKPNQAQIAAFEHTAIALGNETLISGIYSTPAATLTRLLPNGKQKQESLVDFRYCEDPIPDPKVFADRFSAALDLAFGRLLERNLEKEFVVPLSGGLDSRLVAVWLKKLGAPNVTCFTYGKEDSNEGNISRQVAEDLGLKWFYITMDPKEVRLAWNEFSDGFLRATWKGTSLPHVQDWFALLKMRHEHLISGDAIFLPGHTIVGNMHDESLVAKRSTRAETMKSLLRYYANMQGKWKSAGTLSAIQKEFGKQISKFPSERPRDVQDFFEWFNLYNRQAKYINNSMASYEHFGYSWALPMLDKEVWQTWLSGAESLTVNRRWYAEFVAKKFADQTGKRIELFEPPSTNMPELPKRILLRLMRVTKTDVLLDRYRSAKTIVDHPLSFEAFTDVPKVIQFIRVLCGTNQLGLWTKEFLNNSWGNQGSIVPET